MKIVDSLRRARRSVAIRLASWELHRRGEQLLDVFTLERRPGTCSCGAQNGEGVWITNGPGELYCPSCAPATKRCARCGEDRTIGEFRINKARCIIEAYCRSCEQAKNLEHYHSKKDQLRAVPTSKRCIHCRTVKPAHAFQRDGRKADGLTSWCMACAGAR
jgi:hypothetical protein